MGQILYPYSDAANYSFDNTKIEVADGVARLIGAQGGTAPEPFDGLWKFNESSYNGTTGEIIDSSGNGLDGTSQGAEASTDSKLGSGAIRTNFNYFETGGFNAAGSDYSVAFWVKVLGLTNDVAYLVSKPYAYELYFYQNKIHINIRNGGNSPGATYDIDYTDSANWHHIALTFNKSANEFKIYVDGVNVLTQNDDKVADSNEGNSSLKGGALTDVAKGDILVDALFYYKRLLSDTEISDLYNNGAGTEEGVSIVYPSDKPAISTINPPTISDPKWLDFIEVLGANNQGSVRYQLSEDGSNWLYWNGTSWTSAAIDQYNDASIINDNIGSFPTTTGKIYVKAFLISDGSQQVELDQITIDYEHVAAEGRGNTAAVAISAEDKRGNTAVVRFEETTDRGNTGYVGDHTTDNRGNSGAVELSASGAYGNAAAVEFDTAEGRGNDAVVDLKAVETRGNSGAVEFPSSGSYGSTGYVGDRTTGSRGNSGGVYLTAEAAYGDTGYVSIGGAHNAGNTGTVYLTAEDTRGNSANVATSAEYAAGNSGSVETGGTYPVGNDGRVELSADYSAGNEADVKLLKPVSNTASVVVVPTFYELRDFEIFDVIDCHISAKGEGDMHLIKGAKEYIYLRIKDKFGHIPDIAAGWVSFSLFDANGDVVVDSAAVERVEYTDEEESGYVYRYLLDTTGISVGVYNAVFQIENGDELIIRRDQVEILE